MSDIHLCLDKECTGCFACEGVCSKHAIHQRIDKEGFRRPVIDTNLCVSCHACEKICPEINPISKYCKGKVYAAWSLDNNIRTSSSSGGIFSELALYILRKGGVVVGAHLDKDGYVRHSIISNESSLNLLQGSKYVQSLLDGEVYHEIRKLLLEDRYVLFSGCPCQVAGVRSFFKANENLFTVDIVCHGVPSPELFADVFRKLKQQIPSLISYNFRKLDSWAGCNSVNVDIKKGRNKINYPLTGELTFYQDAFMKGLISRPACYVCKYTTIERVGDITLADFWGIGQVKPLNAEYQLGCSMVSVNSNKGNELFNKIRSNLFSEERSIEETIDGGNHQIVNPSYKPKARDHFYDDYRRMRIDKLIKKYDLKILRKDNLLQRIKNKIKTTIGNQ